MDLRLPKRPSEHVKESASWKILHDRVPEKWILREVTERDYGIDCYIELVSTKGYVTGDLLSGQLKATDGIDWRDRDGGREATFSGVEVSTVNYWMRLPVPVFLFVADIKERKLYFAAVKEQVREQYENLAVQDTISFKIVDAFELGTEVGNLVLAHFYWKERNRERLAASLRMLIVHWKQYLEFLQTYQNLDLHMGVEPDEENLFLHIYSSCMFACQLLGIEWRLEDLGDIYKQDAKTWPNNYYRLHYWTFNRVLPGLEQVFFEIIAAGRKLVTIKEKPFWEKTDFVLYEICTGLDFLKPGYSPF